MKITIGQLRVGTRCIDWQGTKITITGREKNYVYTKSEDGLADIYANCAEVTIPDTELKGVKNESNS